jgi:predicted transcriptional regulator
MSDMDVKAALEALTRRAGLRQTDIAAECGCSQPNIAYHMSSKPKKARPSAQLVDGIRGLMDKHSATLAQGAAHGPQ